MYCFISKTYYTYNMKKKIFTILIILTYGIGMFWSGFQLNAYSCRAIPFARTDNLQKVNDIQAIIANYSYPSILYLDGSNYYIDILGATKNYIDYTAVELAEKNIITEDVFIYPNFNPYLYITTTKPKKLKKLENLLNKNLSKRLSHIEGVYNAKVNIKIPFLTLYEPYTVTANVIIKTNKNFDIEKITNITKILLAASVPTLKKENIKIDFIEE